VIRCSTSWRACSKACATGSSRSGTPSTPPVNQYSFISGPCIPPDRRARCSIAAYAIWLEYASRVADSRGPASPSAVEAMRRVRNCVTARAVRTIRKISWGTGNAAGPRTRHACRSSRGRGRREAVPRHREAASVLLPTDRRQNENAVRHGEPGEKAIQEPVLAALPGAQFFRARAAAGSLRQPSGSMMAVLSCGA